jgi:hypothetical protein
MSSSLRHNVPMPLRCRFSLRQADSMSRCLRSFANRRIASLRLVVVFASLVIAIAPAASADDGADAIINKGIKAIGGEARLAKARATTSKIKGTFISGDNASEFKVEQTTDGLDRMRSIFKGDGGGHKFTTTTVIDGDKGWRKEGEMEVMELEGEQLADEKWGHFSQSIALTLVSLKAKSLKANVEAVGDEKVGEKPAAGVKVTGPDDKYFTIYFDKQSGLPVKIVAVLPDPESVGQEFTQETYFSDYKDYSGIKRAKKVDIKRDGKTFIKIELVDVQVLDKVDDKTFAKPE